MTPIYPFCGRLKYLSNIFLADLNHNLWLLHVADLDLLLGPANTLHALFDPLSINIPLSELLCNKSHLTAVRTSTFTAPRPASFCGAQEMDSEAERLAKMEAEWRCRVADLDIAAKEREIAVRDREIAVRDREIASRERVADRQGCCFLLAFVALALSVCFGRIVLARKVDYVSDVARKFGEFLDSPWPFRILVGIGAAVAASLATSSVHLQRFFAGGDY